MSLILAISQKGPIALMIVEGAINQLLFLYFIDKRLVILTENLKHSKSTCYLQFDNFQAHKTATIMNYLNENKINIIFNPPNITEVNPVENYFNVIKVKVREQSFHDRYYNFAI